MSEISGITEMNDFIGPTGVRALPVAAGTNEGGHYFGYFSTFPPFFLFLDMDAKQKSLLH